MVRSNHLELKKKLVETITTTVRTREKKELENKKETR